MILTIGYRCEPTDDGKHRYAAVLQLSLPQEFHIVVIGESDGIKFSVSLNQKCVIY